MSYAVDTVVPVERTQSDIKKVLTTHKATAFAFAESHEKAMVQFEMGGRRIKFLLPLPVKGLVKDRRGKALNQDQIDQRCRSRWRALLLAIKAKLECVEAGITTLEQEFLAHIVMSDGRTVGDMAIPQIAENYRTGKMPNLLTGSVD